MLNDPRDSGALVEDNADVVILIHREDVHDKDPPRRRSRPDRGEAPRRPNRRRHHHRLLPVPPLPLRRQDEYVTAPLPGLELHVGVSRLMPDGCRIRRGAESCGSCLYVVRVERRRLEGRAAVPGTAGPAGTVASIEGPAPRGWGTRRPQGRPPHQDAGATIVVRRPHTQSKTYFSRRIAS